MPLALPRNFISTGIGETGALALVVQLSAKSEEYAVDKPTKISSSLPLKNSSHVGHRE